MPMTGLLGVLVVIVVGVLLQGLRCNLVISGPPQNSYEVGEILPISWRVLDALTSKAPFTVELLNARPEVLLEPMKLAVINDLDGHHFDWPIPRHMKSSNEYRIRISASSNSSTSYFSRVFELVNSNPHTQSTLKVVEPSGSPDGTNLETACLRGEHCQVTWDFPAWALTALPKSVDIVLYDSETLAILQVLARDIPVTQKSHPWLVPKYASSPQEPWRVFVAVVASGSHNLIGGWGLSTYQASSGFPFRMESRVERESRHLEAPRTRDFTEPGPIKFESSGDELLNVPRPTFAVVEVEVETATSSANAVQIPKLLLLVLSLVLLLI